jgi:hypothetical protein
MSSVNLLGERDGRATHDAERKSRTARAAKEDGDQVWASGIDGEAMRTSEITFWLRCNAPRGEPLEQIARRLIGGV